MRPHLRQKQGNLLPASIDKFVCGLPNLVCWPRIACYKPSCMACHMQCSAVTDAARSHHTAVCQRFSQPAIGTVCTKQGQGATCAENVGVLHVLRESQAHLQRYACTADMIHVHTCPLACISQNFQPGSVLAPFIIGKGAMLHPG